MALGKREGADIERIQHLLNLRGSGGSLPSDAQRTGGVRPVNSDWEALFLG